jgi:hypothetical protein
MGNKSEVVLKKLKRLENEHEYHRARFLALDKAHPNQRNFPELNMKLSNTPSLNKGWFRKEMVSREKQILKLIRSS